MASQELTRKQCLLLQRHYDGDLSAAESVQAEQLLERSASARVFMRALEELSHSVRAAARLAWEQVEDVYPSASVLTELAASAGDLAEAPLEELAPVLERFHDGEADEAEAVFITALLEERDDAVDYLASLDEIAQSMRAVGEEMAGEVDFDGFWDGIAAEIGADPHREAPTTSFDRDEHLVLLHRYADGEVDADEASLVEAWREAGDRQVVAYLEALDEVQLGVTAAVETACERVDLHGIWTGVEAGIAAEDSPNVVPLGDARTNKKSGGSESSNGVSWLGEYRQAIVGALAAAVVLAGLVGLFKDEIFGPQERVIVEKRVVVVEKVEYSPDSFVRIDSSVEQASAKSDGEQDPTVIWLFDSGNDKGADEASGEQGEEAAPADTPADSSDAGPSNEDAGQKPAPPGQPI